MVKKPSQQASSRPPITPEQADELQDVSPINPMVILQNLLPRKKNRKNNVEQQFLYMNQCY